jgi:hypothetical protein
VRIEGEPVYSNGQNFAEVCVTIDAYATEEDSEKFKAQTLTKKTCKEGDEKTIKQETEEKAILKALTAYDQQVQEHPPEKVLPLLHDVTVLEGGFEPETEFYCAKVSGVIYPIELMGVLAVVPTPTPEEGKDKFSVDLTEYELGDIPTELGRNLAIGQTEKGYKYIHGQAVNPSGEIEIEDLELSDSFELILKVALANRRHTEYPAQSLNIQSDTGKEITVWWVWPDYFGDAIYGVTGFGQAKIFINNQFFGSMFVKSGVNYSKVLMKGIIDYDAIYELSGRKL